MVIFRKATESDVRGIARLEKEIFADPWSEQSVSETMNEKCTLLSVAEKNGEIVAYCIVYCVLEIAEVARIATDQRYRRMGIARELMDYTATCCKEKKCERILLDVRESNDGARSFYQKYGFAEDGIRKNYYEQPKEHAVLMSMEL